MYVRMYVCTHVGGCIHIGNVCMYVCMYLCTYVSMYVCTPMYSQSDVCRHLFVCTYICTYVFTADVCMHLHVCMYAHACIQEALI
jgi:hypothetical protein